MDFIILPLMLGVLYVVMIRPQQKRQREMAAMLGGLQIDDDVITAGGMYGTIVDLDEDSVDLRVGDPGPVLRFRREAITRVVREDSDDDLDGTTDQDVVPEDVVAADESGDDAMRNVSS